MSDRLKTLADALEWALGRISDRGEYWDRANEILATMSSPAAKVDTEDAMHIAHCNSGEYRGVCKYGSNNCSALLEAMAPAAPESFYVRFAKEWITADDAARCDIKGWIEGWYGEVAPAAPVAAVGEAVAWAVFALVDGVMVMQFPTSHDEAGAKLQATMYSKDYVVEVRPLYAAPRPRSSPLTEAQAVRALDECFTPDDERTSTAEEIAHSRAFCVAIVRAVEAAHGIVPDPSLQTR